MFAMDSHQFLIYQVFSFKEYVYHVRTIIAQVKCSIYFLKSVIYSIDSNSIRTIFVFYYAVTRN